MTVVNVRSATVGGGDIRFPFITGRDKKRFFFSFLTPPGINGGGGVEMCNEYSWLLNVIEPPHPERVNVGHNSHDNQGVWHVIASPYLVIFSRSKPCKIKTAVLF